VQYQIEFGAAAPRLREHLIDAVEKALRPITGHRGCLGNECAFAIEAYQHHIGEGAADIEAECIARSVRCVHGEPVTASVCPVTQSEASPAKNSTALAMSAGVPMRRIATRASSASRSLSLYERHWRS